MNSFIALTQGKTAIIDAADFEKVRQYKWYADKMKNGWYAATTIAGCNIRLHRFLLEPPADKQIDHRNGDGLDNRRENLRVVSQAENIRGFKRKRLDTSSKFRGVCWDKRNKKWMARAMRVYIGRFKSEVEAAKAYNIKARELGFAEEALNQI